MLCSWTKWKSSRKKVLLSILPLRPTTKPLCSPSQLQGPRQMEGGRLAVWHTSILRTAPRTSQCCRSPPQASWQQVSLLVDGEARGSSICFCLFHHTSDAVSNDQHSEEHQRLRDSPEQLMKQTHLSQFVLQLQGTDNVAGAAQYYCSLYEKTA